MCKVNNKLLSDHMLSYFERVCDSHNFNTRNICLIGCSIQSTSIHASIHIFEMCAKLRFKFRCDCGQSVLHYVINTDRGGLPLSVVCLTLCRHSQPLAFYHTQH